MSSVFFDHATIDAWIAEDAPLVDLTTHLLAVGDGQARMRFTVRGEAVAACTEEAARIVRHCGGQVETLLPSGTPVAAGDVLLAATGDAAGLLRAWKVAQNLLEYACGVAGATARMVRAVQAAAPGVAVLTTRKHAPGLRRIALKATLSGGAFPHRRMLHLSIIRLDGARPRSFCANSCSLHFCGPPCRLRRKRQSSRRRRYRCQRGQCCCCRPT